MQTAFGSQFSFQTCCLVVAFGTLVLAQPSPAFCQTAAVTSKTESLVPFVGCKSDGQTGPQKAPNGKPVLLPLPAKFAERLAYYKSEQSAGVLAPRGWYCFGTYGSSGDTL